MLLCSSQGPPQLPTSAAPWRGPRRGPPEGGPRELGTGAPVAEEGSPGTKEVLGLQGFQGFPIGFKDFLGFPIIVLGFPRISIRIPSGF